MVAFWFNYMDLYGNHYRRRRRRRGLDTRSIMCHVCVGCNKNIFKFSPQLRRRRRRRRRSPLL